MQTRYQEQDREPKEIYDSTSNENCLENLDGCYESSCSSSSTSSFAYQRDFEGDGDDFDSVEDEFIFDLEL